MGRRTRRRGGKAIASGSDGCVFDGTFAPDGTFTKTEDTVTKVFTGPNVPIAEQEYAMMKRVAEATGGSGVLVSSIPPTAIATIPETAWENDQIKSFAACKKAVEQPTGPFAGLVLPRIAGTLLDLRKRNELPLPASAFDAMDGAIRDMGTAKLVHMDLARRNLFYTINSDQSKTVLLGDFGSTIDVTDDAAIQAFVAKYGMQGKFTACMKTDGINPIALALMIGYDAFLRGKDAFEAYIQDLRAKRYYANTFSIATETWVAKTLDNALTDLTVDADTFTEFLTYLEKQFDQILALLSAEGKTYETVEAAKVGFKSTVQRLLITSDRRMFEVVRLLATKESVNSDDLRALSAVWFPNLIRPAQGGGARRIQRHRGGQTEYTSIPDALAEPDPVLVENTNPKPISANVTFEMVGGGPRRIRVKTLRKKKWANQRREKQSRSIGPRCLKSTLRQRERRRTVCRGATNSQKPCTASARHGSTCL